MSNHTKEEEMEEAIIRRTKVARDFFSILLLLVGTLGNAISFMVMKQKSMRKTSAGVYFAVLSIADTAFLYFGLVPFLIDNMNDIDIYYINSFLCKFGKFLNYGSGDYAIWVLLGITVDRFIAITFPLKAKVLCTPGRAKMVCAGLLLLVIVKDFHLFFTRGQTVINEGNSTIVLNCGKPTEAYYFFETYVRPWIAFVCLAIIPTISMFLLNCFMIKALVRMRQLRESMQKDKSKNEQENKESKQIMQMTITFLSVSVTFLFLVPPCFTVLMLIPYLSLSEGHTYALRNAVIVLLYVNHSINFFLYCLTGRGFRRDARRVLCFWRTHSRVDDVISMATNHSSVK